MGLIPSVELDGVSGVLAIVAAVGVAIVFWYATAFASFVVGSIVFLAVVVVLYYILVRLDRWFRGSGGRV